MSRSSSFTVKESYFLKLISFFGLVGQKDDFCSFQFSWTAIYGVKGDRGENKMPNAKYDYIVMGKVAKNSRNKAQKEIIDLLKASDELNLETINKKIDIFRAEQKELSDKFTRIEEKLSEIIREIQ
jgi:hypothetical protein